MTQKYIKIFVIRVINSNRSLYRKKLLNESEWLRRLNIAKCKCVSYCVEHPTDTIYHVMDSNQLFPLENVKSVVDLGVCFDSNLTFRDHMSEKIRLTVY